MRPVGIAEWDLLQATCRNAQDGNIRVGIATEWATGPDGACTFDWTETNGPVVIPPTRTGLGTRLLKRQPAFREVTMDFRPEGLHCAITLDAAMVVSRQQ